jgi:hypothetical protein
MSAPEAAQFVVSELSALNCSLAFAERLRQAHLHLKSVQGQEDEDHHRTLAEEMIFNELGLRLTEIEVERQGGRIIH